MLNFSKLLAIAHWDFAKPHTPKSTAKMKRRMSSRIHVSCLFSLNEWEEKATALKIIWGAKACVHILYSKIPNVFFFLPSSLFTNDLSNLWDGSIINFMCESKRFFFLSTQDRLSYIYVSLFRSIKMFVNKYGKMLKYSLFILNSIELTEKFSSFTHLLFLSYPKYHSVLLSSFFFFVYILREFSFFFYWFMCQTHTSHVAFSPKMQIHNEYSRVWMSSSIKIERMSIQHDLRTSRIVFEMIWFSFGAGSAESGWGDQRCHSRNIAASHHILLHGYVQ